MPFGAARDSDADPGGHRLGLLTMAHHELTPPCNDAQIRALRVNDTVTLQGVLFGIRDATQIHMFDRGRRTRFDLAGHAVIHTAPNVAKVERSAAHPAGYAPLCVGTTTSDRMERFTRPLMAQCGVRIVIGKGGLRDDSLAAFRELGGVYLAIIGGTAALETTWIERIDDVDLDDLHPESLWKFRVRDFGPLLVAMDSHGASVYDGVRSDAAARRARVLARLGVKG
jgi:L(+)-tartrate dehydratase beta subunit